MSGKEGQLPAQPQPPINESSQTPNSPRRFGRKAFLRGAAALVGATVLEACAPAVTPTPAKGEEAPTDIPQVAAAPPSPVGATPIDATATSAPITDNPTAVPPSPTAAPLSSDSITPTVESVNIKNVSDIILKRSLTAYMKAAGSKSDFDSVVKSLRLEKNKRKDGGEFWTVRTQDDTSLSGTNVLIGRRNERGEVEWSAATIGNYWGSVGKFVGTYTNGDQFKSSQNKKLISEHFGDGGAISLNGQVRPGPDIAERKPSNANSVMQLAKQSGMAVNFHYVVEPGKYPPSVDKNNVDGWLDSRISEIIDTIQTNKPNQPVLIEYNEAWSTKKATINEERDPLKDQYPENWAEQFIFKVMAAFIDKGLIPNKDFIVMFNENRMYTNPEKQRLVYKTLASARAGAYARLITDPKTLSFLNTNGILKPEDIMIPLGSETHTKLEQQVDDGTFIPDPSADQIKGLGAVFSDLGGVIMTEVNPHGNADQKGKFANKLTSLLRNDPNLRGAIFFHVFEPGDQSGLMSSRVELFDQADSPSALYYQMLQVTAAV